MKVTSVALRLATASVALLGLAFTTTGNAYAATYDGQDPASSGCSNSAITAKVANIWGYDGTLVGKIQLRYSTGCRTVWGRILAYNGPYNAHAYVMRNSDHASYNCTNSTWVSNLGAYSCYTRMLNDVNVTSYAWGYAATFDNVISSGETGSY